MTAAYDKAIAKLEEIIAMLERGRIEAPPMTNADRIRSMSDEKLAEALAILAKADVCLNSNAMGCEECPFFVFCSDCIEGSELEWLQQPAKEDA